MTARRLTARAQVALDALDHRALTAHELAARLDVTPRQARSIAMRLHNRGLVSFDAGSLRYSRAEA